LKDLVSCVGGREFKSWDAQSDTVLQTSPKLSKWW